MARIEIGFQGKEGFDIMVDHRSGENVDGKRFMIFADPVYINSEAPHDNLLKAYDEEVEKRLKEYSDLALDARADIKKWIALNAPEESAEAAKRRKEIDEKIEKGFYRKTNEN